MVDDNYINGRLCGFELEPELFLQRGLTETTSQVSGFAAGSVCSGSASVTKKKL